MVFLRLTGRAGACVRLLGAALVAAAVALYGCARSQQAQVPGGQARPPVAVAVQKVQRATVEKELVVGGQVAGIRKAVVGPKVSGRVADVAVALGQYVAAGAVLFELDRTEVESQLRQARANLTRAEENKKLADINRENARKKLERYKELFAAGAVSQDAYEQVLAEYERAMVKTAEADLEGARAQLEVLEAQLANMTVRAPFGGLVSKVNVNVGEVVSPSSQCVELVDIGRVKVAVSVGEEEVNRLRVGQECRVVVAAAGPGPFTGKITAIGPAADDKSKAFNVEVTVDNPEGLLKPGMYAEVHLVVGRAENALAVPVDAVVSKGNKKAVFVVEGDTARERAVVTGISDGKLVEVKEGLAGDEQVVVVGQQGLTDGAKVVVSGGAAPGGRPAGAGPAGGTGAAAGRQAGAKQ
ncbi:efflux RND transporter periplasmic adaptor subunit [Desulfovirgula thermocuniculi]|uniref:efflux RND transporter periplasmic adaptor subunit n=1 Tax=Desulfovirgula thermocuniculi TaxID=348842 RepID=UPI000483B915|nr:efflux RND transporter periplasmic adaptor subunit [Desulfovirgula thermocuniculi]